MNTSETTSKVATALVKAQAEMLPLIKDSKNPFFKSKYADLHAVTNACYPALQANGISVIQSAESMGSDGINVVTRLQHESGEFIETSCAIPPAGNDPQKYGSAVTYGRRYGLAAATGLAPTDDDGEAAMNRTGASKAEPAKPKVPTIDAILTSISKVEDTEGLKTLTARIETTPHSSNLEIKNALKAKQTSLKK